MAKFEAFEVALQMVATVRPLYERLRQQDRQAALQLKSAMNSVPANIAEGARRAGRDRMQHWRIAAGSADEVCSHLRTAVAWGDLEGPTIVPALALGDRVMAMLFRATHPRR